MRYSDSHTSRIGWPVLLAVLGLAACTDTPQQPPGQAAAERQFPASPVLPHIGGSQIVDYYHASYDVAAVPVAPIAESSAVAGKVVTLVGAMTQHVYRLPADIPKSRAIEFYINVLRNKGFEIVFACRGISLCGTGFGHFVHHGGPVLAEGIDYLGYEPYAAVTGWRLSMDPPGQTYVFIYTGEHDRHRLFQEVVTTGDVTLR